LDSFDDRYLGTKTSDPTLDNDGNALVSGALYFSTTQNVMKVYDGASWITATSAGATSLLRFRYVATSGQTTFSGADAASATLTYTVNNIAVHRNGVTLDTSEYTASNGTSIVLTVAAGTGDIIDIIAFKSFTVADALSAVSGGTVNGAVTVTGALTANGNVILGDASTDTLNVGNGGLVKDASGNVGIGTSSPILGLTIKNDTGSTTYGQRAGSLVLESNNVTAGGGTDVVFSSGTQTNQRYASIGSAIEGNDGAGGSRGSIVFATKAASATTTLTERMRIDTSGNLLVGITSQVEGSKLSVSGSNCLGAQITAVGGGALNANYTAGSGTAYYGYWKYGGGVVGYITSTGSTVNYTSVSDYRLKEDIQPMAGALAKVAALKPCTYKWKVDGSDGQGFIAHELAEICPDAVTGEKDAVDADGNPQYQGIDTSFLVATLTAAIQELKAIVDAQGAEIAALKGTQP